MYTCSLASTIHYHRPDLLSENSSDMIPLNPSFNYFTSMLLRSASSLYIFELFPICSDIILLHLIIAILILYSEPDIPNISELMLASFADETFSPSPFEWYVHKDYLSSTAFFFISVIFFNM